MAYSGMSEEIRKILADGEPVSKSLLRDFLGRRVRTVNVAEGYGLVSQTERLPVPGEDVQAANHKAIMTAIRAAIAQGGGEVTLPSGYIFVNETIEIGNDALPESEDGKTAHRYLQVNLKGAGRHATKLVLGHPSHPLIRLIDPSRGPTKPVHFVRIESMSLIGRGPKTTGNLIEIYSGVNHVLEDLSLEGTAGRAILISRSERMVIRDVIVHKCRQALVMHDACNENYLFNFVPLTCGYTDDRFDPGHKKNWTVNPTDGGELMIREGEVEQESRATVVLEGSQNIRWIGGSCKAMHFLAGVKCGNCENVQIDNVYFEGFPHGNAVPHPSVIMGGAMERTRLTRSVSADEERIAVEDSSWFFRDFSTDRVFRQTSNPALNHFAIYDPDDPTQYEVILGRGFVDGVLYVTQRGADGRPLRLKPASARRWPAGSVLTEMVFGIGDLTLHGNHLEGFQPFGQYPKLRLKEDRAAGKTNGQIVVGYTHDAFFSAPNFPSGDLPGSCYLELTGHNRVRFDVTRHERTERVQAHHRAHVFVSRESANGGLKVESTWEPTRSEAHWLQVSHALTDGDPIRTSVPGGFFNIRRDIVFDRDRAADINLAHFFHLFTARYGAVLSCRLYSLDDENGDAKQGQTFVSDFVVDMPAGRDPTLSVRYLRAAPNFTPHLRLRSGNEGRVVELGLIAPLDHPRKSIRLRFDAISICGQVEETAYPTSQTGPLFALSADDAVTINPVAPGSLQARPAAATGGGEIFIEEGALKYRSPNGTITTIAPS